jgi:hypothetical protein
MGIIDKIKEVAVLALKVKNMELYEKLVSLQSDILALQEENHELKDKVRQLKETSDLRDRVVWEQPFYWLNNDAAKDGPFCQKCWDSDQKLIRLQHRRNDIWDCYNCKNFFCGPHHVPPCGNSGPDGPSQRTEFRV